jgi:D-alanyl-D-alanine carboxypeptidase
MKTLLSLCLLLIVGITNPDKDYLLGRFDPASDVRFSKLRPEHTSGAAMGGYLRKETYEAFVTMADAAGKEGIRLTIISATRNFESQKKIWENKWNGRVQVEGKNLTSVINPEERARIILRYSSMPGSSRHHWGTDMDLNSLENSYFETGDGLRIYEWLTTHAAEYGFCQPYTSKASGRTGYEEEKWHWSYLPLSRPLLDEYIKNIRYEDITGFNGSESAGAIGIIEDYVQGISCSR